MIKDCRYLLPLIAVGQKRVAKLNGTLGFDISAGAV